MFMYSYCYVCSVLCTVCVQMCTVLLPPGVSPVAVNKHITSHHITSHTNRHVLQFKTLFCVPFVCKCVTYCCRRVSAQLQLTNTSHHTQTDMYCNSKHAARQFTAKYIWPTSITVTARLQLLIVTNKTRTRHRTASAEDARRGFFSSLCCRYNPLWVLPFSAIFFHSVLSLLSFLHPLIAILWISSSTSSIHLSLGLPLILLPIGFHYNILLGILPPSIHITCPSQAILLLFINLTVCISYARRDY